MKFISLCKKIYNHFFPPEKTPFEKMVEQWNKDNGDKDLRLAYDDLNQDSIIFDVGGYEGQWASDIFSKYQSTIHVFEPIKKFAESISDRFKKNDRIAVHQFGLSNKNEKVAISVIHDQSSVFKDSQENEVVEMVCVSDFIKQKNITQIDLIKINIEGGEYPLLENLLETGLIKNIKNIQVQFHSFAPNAEQRMSAIQELLKKTHSVTYSYPFVWENWKRNE